MHQLVASPQQNTYLLALPGYRNGARLPEPHYNQLLDAAASDEPVPAWLARMAADAWGLDLAGQPMNPTVLVRPRTAWNYSRATWEVNKGCNFNCEHCYLAQRTFEGMTLQDKFRLIDMLWDAGVLWLQFTGGEPTIDKDFPAAYEYAYRQGMLLEILTNGSRLAHRPLLDLLTRLRPHKTTVSLYGASDASAEALTRTPGAFTRLLKGLTAIQAAGLNTEIAIIITRHNAHEVDAMRALARDLADTVTEYATISPTYDGQPHPLAAQAPGFHDRQSAFAGCPAGHTFFHVDPFGQATMCKVGRENPISLLDTGLDGLTRLPRIADAQMLRTGGCAGCKLSGTCRVCRPLAKASQEAKAPLETYCQHGQRKGVPA
ncbi:radical SAM protein [Streptomyces sp. B-S-A8]|uniref:Radical SAM protein n=1 Tax=Streptomyces solicavernae TaxID=3043614 RepID=A0ABT6RLZ7_9ACTN|nr:radical SAM protein [Streptomyces sp. B-S-A8]MDI3385454.1 radical SAM protein [Streptomyces sp. B-S-A8]